MTAAAEGTEYSVAMELDDWLVIDATMDEELQLLAEEGWDFDDWGEASRDPYWAERSELGHSIRQAGWDQISNWPRDPENMRQWVTASARRTEAMRLTARQWGLVVLALDSRTALEIPDGVRPEYIELLHNTNARRRQVSALVHDALTAQGLTQIPIVQPRGR